VVRRGCAVARVASAQASSAVRHHLLVDQARLLHHGRKHALGWLGHLRELRHTHGGCLRPPLLLLLLLLLLLRHEARGRLPLLLLEASPCEGGLLLLLLLRLRLRWDLHKLLLQLRLLQDLCILLLLWELNKLLLRLLLLLLLLLQPLLLRWDLNKLLLLLLLLLPCPLRHAWLRHLLHHLRQRLLQLLRHLHQLLRHLLQNLLRLCGQLLRHLLENLLRRKLLLQHLNGLLLRRHLRLLHKLCGLRLCLLLLQHLRCHALGCLHEALLRCRLCLLGPLGDADAGRRPLHPQELLRPLCKLTHLEQHWRRVLHCHMLSCRVSKVALGGHGMLLERSRFRQCSANDRREDDQDQIHHGDTDVLH